MLKSEKIGMTTKNENHKRGALSSLSGVRVERHDSITSSSSSSYNDSSEITNTEKSENTSEKDQKEQGLGTVDFNNLSDDSDQDDYMQGQQKDSGEDPVPLNEEKVNEKVRFCSKLWVKGAQCIAYEMTGKVPLIVGIFAIRF